MTWPIYCLTSVNHIETGIQTILVELLFGKSIKNLHKDGTAEFETMLATRNATICDHAPRLYLCSSHCNGLTGVLLPDE